MMKRDFKIGLLIGLAAAGGVTIWLCTMPKLSTEKRALQSAILRPSKTTSIPVESKKAETPARPMESMQNIQPMKSEKPSRIHIVEKNDNLSSISEKYYGSPRDWHKIAAANREILPDANHLKPGLRLLIPE